MTNTLAYLDSLSVTYKIYKIQYKCYYYKNIHNYKKVIVFVPNKFCQPGLIFAGRLTPWLENIKLDWKGLSGTNTRACLDFVDDKGIIWNIDNNFFVVTDEESK